MISALVYLQYHSIVNRVVMRFKRLKQPKYLFGAIVGALYFYWYFFRNIISLGRHRPGFPVHASPETLVLLQSFGALALFVIVVLAWILPHQRSALTFTEAEVAFLFPAPISRRGLIHFKLARSQLSILFTTFFLMLVTNRFGGNALFHAAGWWLILSTLNLHFLGSSFTMTALMDRGISNWQRRLGVVLVAAGLVVGIGFWVKHSMPSLDLLRMPDWDAAREQFQQILDSGPALWLLMPFRLLVHPFFAQNAQEFLLATGPALLLMGLHYLWVVRANVAFEEASLEASQKQAERLAAIRSGNWRSANRKVKAKPPPFPLASTGWPAAALFWKNLISTTRSLTMRTWGLLLGTAIVLCFGISRVSGGQAALIGIGMPSGMALGWLLILGAQVTRRDFRQDLLVADLLKTYPLPGWQVALGEILAPAIILTRIEWLLLVPAGAAFVANPTTFSTGTKVAIWVSAAVLIPFLNLITLQIPNAAVLLFPAWFQLGKDSPQGIEATGQRLIFLVGQVLVLAVSLIPAALVGGLIFFLLKLVAPLGLAILLGSLAASLALGIEAAFGLVLLGSLFNRFDIASELNP